MLMKSCSKQKVKHTPVSTFPNASLHVVVRLPGHVMGISVPTFADLMLKVYFIDESVVGKCFSACL